MWDPAQWRTDRQTDTTAAATEGGGEREGGGAVPMPVPVLTEAAQTLKEPGYVFGLVVLPDAKSGSQLYALAGARYNTVHICL